MKYTMVHKTTYKIATLTAHFSTYLQIMKTNDFLWVITWPWFFSFHSAHSLQFCHKHSCLCPFVLLGIFYFHALHFLT